MTRTFLLAALCLVTPAFADTVDEHLNDAQKDINMGKRKAANDELKAQQKALGNTDLTSLDSELRNKLGDDWTVKKSGSGFLATRVAVKKADTKLTQKINDQMREYRGKYHDAQVMRHGDEIMLRGRIDDCADIASATNDFATIDGVNRVFVDVSCSPNR